MWKNKWEIELAFNDLLEAIAAWDAIGIGAQLIVDILPEGGLFGGCMYEPGEILYGVSYLAADDIEAARALRLKGKGYYIKAIEKEEIEEKIEVEEVEV